MNIFNCKLNYFYFFKIINNRINLHLIVSGKSAADTRAQQCIPDSASFFFWENLTSFTFISSRVWIYLYLFLSRVYPTSAQSTDTSVSEKPKTTEKGKGKKNSYNCIGTKLPCARHFHIPIPKSQAIIEKKILQKAFTFTCLFSF